MVKEICDFQYPRNHGVKIKIKKFIVTLMSKDVANVSILVIKK